MVVALLKGIAFESFTTIDYFCCVVIGMATPSQLLKTGRSQLEDVLRVLCQLLWNWRSGS